MINGAVIQQKIPKADNLPNTPTGIMLGILPEVPTSISLEVQLIVYEIPTNINLTEL